MRGLPIVDLAPMRDGAQGVRQAAASIDQACRDVGFFYVVGHGVDPSLQARLDAAARQFFALPEAEKAEIAMARGGRAWRGWFPVGGELTAGTPDDKEGLYFGADLGADDRRVTEATPLHGANLYPRRPPELRTVVQDYMGAMTAVGQAVLSAMAVGLGLEASWFSDDLTAAPLTLFRIFRYPGRSEADAAAWGVGEHTDYGLLTLLGQDDRGGLQVRTPRGWVDASPRPGAIVCNLGDMLERLTGGRYRSTPHRVRNTTGTDRLSFPFFLDPSWESVVHRLPIVARPSDDGAARRWDHASVHGFEGTYGEYIFSKVGKVFPHLADQVALRDHQ